MGSVNLSEERVGVKNKMSNGQIAEIIRYRKASDIDIMFEDKTIVNNRSYYSFIDGKISNPNYISNRLGEVVFYNNCNQNCKIVKYIGATNIDIQFEDGTIIRNASYGTFKNKGYRNPNCPVVNSKYNYVIGQGKYNTINNTEIKTAHKGMFERCYDEMALKKHPTYIGCKICEDWSNFQMFAKWFDDNKWTNDEKLYVDKDILIKGNKLYSPETCILVPSKINKLFIKSDRLRNGLIGTWLNPKTNRYVAQCNYGCKTNRNIGTFDTEIEAFYAYKEVKERYIKQIADDYKNKYSDFPNKLYEAMYSYKVEITD